MAGFRPGEKSLRRGLTRTAPFRVGLWPSSWPTLLKERCGIGVYYGISVFGFQRVIVRMESYGREGRALHEASPLPLLSYTFFPSFSSFFSKFGCFFRKKQWNFTEYTLFERYAIPSPRGRLYDRFPRSSFSAQKGNGASRDRGWPLGFICLWYRAYLAVPVR